MKPVLVIIRGVSGSGKSTFAEMLVESFEGNSCRFEADQWFVENDEPWNPRYLATAHEWCRESVKQSLKDGYITVVSNTTTTKKELDPYIKIAQELGVPYYIIIADGDYTNVHDVPIVKVEKQVRQFYFNNINMRWCQASK